MIIGLNGQNLLEENPAGPEKYTFNIYKTLAKIDNENFYEIYFNDIPSEEFWYKLVGNNPNFKKIVIKNERLWTQLGLASYLLKNTTDVFFTPIHTLPVVRNKKTKYIPMIHGLEHTYAQGFKNVTKKFSIERPVKYACEKADHIIVPSLATKSAILNKKWSTDAKITIIHEGIDNSFFKNSESEINNVRNKYNLENKDYLFFISTIQPRKNLPTTIKAFAKFISDNPDFNETLLVIAGKNGWDFEESLNAPKEFDIENNVRFIGRIDDEDRAPLMSGAKAFINLSLEEGFGLPLVEAMACETMCLVSDIPAFREVGGHAPVFVDPRNVDLISKELQNIFNYSIEKVEDTINNGKTRAYEFTWEKTAQKTLDLFEHLVKNK